MDFSDKTMASPGSACLGEVPGMVMNNIMLETEEEEEEKEGVNIAESLLKVETEAWEGNKASRSCLLSDAREGDKIWKKCVSLGSWLVGNN